MFRAGQRGSVIVNLSDMYDESISSDSEDSEAVTAEFMRRLENQTIKGPSPSLGPTYLFRQSSNKRTRSGRKY